ncbi:MAG: 2,3-bisphosphoglycerate-independent phosphoglycerate mutase, partial [Candidatus Paceibacteria bacterium]
NLIEKLEATIKEIGTGRIASISGRFYAMDRDENWSRTEKVFRLLTEGGKIMQNVKDIINEAYSRDLTDEFIEPSLIGTSNELDKLLIKNGDAIIFFNFREDGIKQLAQAFSDPSFEEFPRPNLELLYIVTMTQYTPELRAYVAFPKESITEPLGLVLSQNEKRQLRIAESERAAHVTFFFNGLRPQPFPGEYWVIVPTPKTLHFDKVPQLASEDILSRLIQSMEERIYDFILVNFANPDIIADTGNFDAAIKVVELMDKIVNKISAAALNLKISLIITSDHGNIESMLDPLTARVETKHNLSPVPFYLVDKRFFRERLKAEIESGEKEIAGSLVDVAPTVLELLGLKKPPTMTGQSLLRFCK